MDDIQQMELNYPQLKELGEQLRQTYAKCIRLESGHMKLGKMSLNLGIQLGTLLCEAKDIIKHGDFEHWSTVTMQVSGETIRKYRKLADPNYSGLLEKCKNLTEAYKKIRELEIQEKLKTNPVTKSSKELKESEDEDELELYNKHKLSVAKTVYKIVQGVIADEKTVNWSLSHWSIVNDKIMYSDNGSVAGKNLFIWFSTFVADREYKQVVQSDEIIIKNSVVMNQVFQQIILANKPVVEVDQQLAA